MKAAPPDIDDILGTGELLATTRTKARGPEGQLPITAEMLLREPSGNLFGMTQDAGMGWDPDEVGRPQFLIVSTQGGLRDDDGSPIALGYHTGHWEIGLLVQAAAETLRAEGGLPFAAYCSDPCDGRTQGTAGMFDSLPYRNDAAITMRRLIRSLPRRAGVMGIATCDKGLPATMLALAGCRDLPGIVVPGGVTLPAIDGEDAGKVQIDRRALRARPHHPRGGGDRGLPRLRDAGRRLPVPGHGRDVAGGGRGVRPDAAAQRALPVGRAGLAGHGAALGARAGAAGRERHPAVRDPDAARARERDAAARGVRRLDEPAAAHPRARARRRAAAADRRGLEPRSTAPRRAWSTRCPTARATTRPCRCSWRAACRR